MFRSPPHTVIVDDPDRELVGAVFEEYPHGTRWFTEIVGIHWSRVWTLCEATLLDPVAAEEAVKQTFLRVHRRLGSYAFDRPFATWMCGLALETADRILAARVLHPGAPGLAPLAWLRPRRGSAAGLPARDVFRHLGVLDRRLLALQLLEDLSDEETAESVGLDPAEVEPRLEAARRRLLDLMGPEPPKGREAARAERGAGILDPRSAALVRTVVSQPDRARIVQAMDQLERQVVLEDLVVMMARAVAEAAKELFDVVGQVVPPRPRPPAARRRQGDRP